MHWRRIHGKEYRFDAWHKIIGDEVVEQLADLSMSTVGNLPLRNFRRVPNRSGKPLSVGLSDMSADAQIQASGNGAIFSSQQSR